MQKSKVIPGPQGTQDQAAAQALAQREAVLKFVSSEGKLKCGHRYDAALDMVSKVNAAETAYAIADVIGVDSKFVEDYADRHCAEHKLDPVQERSKGYAAFDSEVIDVVSNNVLPKAAWLNTAQKKKAEVKQLFDEKGGCRMLRFARAVSALWKEEAPAYTDETFDNSHQAPVSYILSGQRTKGYSSTVFPHAVECATTEDDFRNLPVMLDGYASGRFAYLKPNLQARAQQVGYKGPI